MIDLPDNWEQAESEYNRHYDPCAEICPKCGAEDSFIEAPNFNIVYCQKCHYEVD